MVIIVFTCKNNQFSDSCQKVNIEIKKKYSLPHNKRGQTIYLLCLGFMVMSGASISSMLIPPCWKVSL